jgi:hypothetical protein
LNAGGTESSTAWRKASGLITLAMCLAKANVTRG